MSRADEQLEPNQDENAPLSSSEEPVEGLNAETEAKPLPNEEPDSSEPDDTESPRVETPDPRDLRIRLLEKQLDENEGRLREYIKAHKKAQHEFEGLRDRLRRDQQEQVELAKGRVVERFLDVADNLDRSIQAAQAGGSPDSLLEGVTLVHRMFDQALTELGLEKHDPAGEAFDPTSMEAHGMIPVADASQANTVVNTLRPGYRLHGRELRPALVQVGMHAG